MFTALGVLTAVLLAASAAYYVFAASGSVGAGFFQAQPGSLHWDGRTRLTVLLAGSPNAQTAAGQLLVASLDPGRRELSVLAVPSSMWVTIPGYGQGPIADSYADGGTRLLLLTVESALRIPIPYYAVMDPAGFSRLVDALGGVTVPQGSPAQATASSSGRAVARPATGSPHLSGAAVVAALASAESTVSPGSAARIGGFLTALLQQDLSGGNLLRVPEVISAVGGAIHTNIPYNQLDAVARTVSSVPSSRVSLVQLGAGNQVVAPYQANGATVYLPDWQGVTALSRRLLGVATYPGAAAEVLNGSGVAGQAASLASWLRSAGIPVRGFASAPTSTVAHTQVIVSRHSGRRAAELARDVASLLQVPVVSSGAPASAATVEVLIGQDFQDLSQQ